MLTTLLAAVLGLAQAPALDEATRTLALLRLPEHELRFEGPDANERIRFVRPFLAAYAEVLGWKLALEPGLEAQLEKTETGLSLPGSIARDDLHPLVQTVARLRGLCFRLESDAGLTKLVVESEHVSGRAPIAVPPELLPAWTSHPAFPLLVELPHPKEGSAELCLRMSALLSGCVGRTEVRSTATGAVQLSGSSAVLAFVVDALREGRRRAQGLETATFPPDPNTPEGKKPARLPEALRADFPARDLPLSLYSAGEPPNELEVVVEFGRWDQRPLLFQDLPTRSALEANPGGADLPRSVPPDWAHEFLSGLLADSGCVLRPLPAARPVLWGIEMHTAGTAAPLDPAGIPTIGLSELGAVGHLAATRFQTFVRLPRLTPEQTQMVGELRSPDEQIPFWITELGEPSIFSVIGTPRAITSAVLAMRLALTPPKPR